MAATIVDRLQIITSHTCRWERILLHADPELREQYVTWANLPLIIGCAAAVVISLRAELLRIDSLDNGCLSSRLLYSTRQSSALTPTTTRHIPYNSSIRTVCNTRSRHGEMCAHSDTRDLLEPKTRRRRMARRGPLLPWRRLPNV